METKTNLLTKENLEEFMKKQEEYNTLSENLADKEFYRNNEIQNIKDKFNDDHELLIQKITDLQESMESDRELFKEGALMSYNESGEKKHLGGLGIRVTKKVEYDDELALTWAKEHELCLKLDNKSFEKLAKIQNIEGVTIKDVPTATFPSKIKLE